MDGASAEEVKTCRSCLHYSKILLSGWLLVGALQLPANLLLRKSEPLPAVILPRLRRSALAFATLALLKGLKQYQYKPAGYTILDDLHQPFWNWLVSKLPMWLAPNLITLTGIFGLVIAYLVSAWYLPGFEGDAPRWVYFLNGLAVLVYLHLDCIDGKQARRTGSSSPLGQLFDHGCDALSVHLVLSTIAATLSIGYGVKAVVGAMTVMTPWVLAHWEEYHTGVMNYGNGWWGVTEANYALVIVHWLTAAVGPWLWRARLADAFGVAWLGPWNLTDALLAVEGFTTAVLVIQQVWRGITLARTALPAEERGHKQMGKRQAGSHLLQVVLLLALGALMMLQPVAGPYHARAVLVTYGLIYASEASGLILDHMAKEPFEISWWSLAAMAVSIVNSRLHIIDPQLMAWALAGLVLASYLHYTYYVVDEICNFLGIKCLRIKQVKRP